MTMSAEALVQQLLGREAIVAARAVAEAASLARWVQRGGMGNPLDKPDLSPVTVADFAVQALVAWRLASECPGLPLVAEEDAARLRAAESGDVCQAVLESVRRFEHDADLERVLAWVEKGSATPGHRFWTLDPIDGTKGYLRSRQYAIALALVEDGVVQLAALACPSLSLSGPRSVRTAGALSGHGGLAVAVRGRGAWWLVPAAEEMTRLTVSATRDPARARVLHSFEPAHSRMDELGQVLHAMGIQAGPLLMDSQAKHAVLAAGRADLLLRFPTRSDAHDWIWDQAAGALLIEEAGGQVSDLTGRPLDFSTGRRLLRNSGLVASNGWLHDAALRTIAAGPSLARPHGADDAQTSLLPSG
jgi:3'(2'), 5'-bisphosphate nucleotidase